MLSYFYVIPLCHQRVDDTGVLQLLSFVVIFLYFIPHKYFLTPLWFVDTYITLQCFF